MSLAALVLAVAASQAQQPDATALAVRVNAAIARGVAHLKRTQLADGNWPGHEKEHPGGTTALAAYTLLKSGVRRGDAALDRAQRAVLATEFVSVYSHSARLLFLDALGDPSFAREPARTSLDFLVAKQVEGLWAYPWGEVDLSNTQFALLGLRAAAHLGLEIPERTLKSSLQALPRWESKSGGFPYAQRFEPTGGMSAATLAGFEVLSELAQGHGSLASLLDKAAPTRTQAEHWLVSRFDMAHNSYGPRSWTPTFQYAYMWAVERFAGLSKRERIGEHAWYAEGAEWLVANQNDDGGWGGSIEETCFALLFLRRATITTGDDGPADAADERERKPVALVPADDLPYCTDFLLAGPWKSDESGLALVQPPFEPKKARPKLGDKLARREWTRIALKSDGWTNLEDLVENERGEHELYALATTIAWSDDEPLDATLWFHVEDGWDVYFDGERVTFGQRVQAPIDGRVRADVVLARGEHTLLALVEEETGSVPFALRISDRGGKRLAHAPQVWAVEPKATKR